MFIYKHLNIKWLQTKKILQIPIFPNASGAFSPGDETIVCFIQFRHRITCDWLTDYQKPFGVLTVMFRAVFEDGNCDCIIPSFLLWLGAYFGMNRLHHGNFALIPSFRSFKNYAMPRIVFDIFVCDDMCHEFIKYVFCLRVNSKLKKRFPQILLWGIFLVFGLSVEGGFILGGEFGNQVFPHVFEPLE